MEIGIDSFAAFLPEMQDRTGLGAAQALLHKSAPPRIHLMNPA
ncbi:hypothetical protein DFP92_11931 [Yoonia sediminilitoris]|uniref:Uncharacterized protein n=1 Tax=Yoonia sediminilitoris TaxID=1286148 RepID=A0A2T6K6U8_9RHOB|nr:hypothetical protein C8N45_11931 [Yoonia sediminilitoris]RCW89870.1 hypothetical protein DFP92_11931 [Yoonia sediminilitoris]